MSTPLICYILVGTPGCGKSTLAAKIVEHNPEYRIVSTDQIRAELFGDASIQGNWLEIEAQVLRQIQQFIAAGQPVIYDATNFKRPNRIALLEKLDLHENVYWVGLQVQTPVERCKIWNQQRQRQVPESVIESMAQYLETFPPIPAEGFAAVYSVAPTENLQLPSGNMLARVITNRKNRTKNITLHRYSKLLDFERLMHLIALLIRYPGVGNLQETSPQTLKRILGTEPSYGSALEEICGLNAHFHTSVNAVSQEIAADLTFLDSSGMLGVFQADFDIPDTEYNGERNTLVAHTYSDWEQFKRLLKTIRYIAQHPFLRAEQQNLNMLLAGLKAHEVHTPQDKGATLRKDIQLALKPYKILLNKPMRHGYFLGTGILAKHELKEVFKVLQSQAESLEDPIAVEIYQAFKDRMQNSNILEKDELAEIYPVRAIANQAIVDIDCLPDYAVYQRLEVLEQAIEKGELLELNRILGTGRFPGDPHQQQPFRCYPLQIVFHNIGWYLGYECAQNNLFRFERLDQIFFIRSLGNYRSRSEQMKSLKKLEKLYKAGLGIFLGNSAEEQKKFLSSDKQEKALIEVTVELWFNEQSFKFISEGTRRFPKNQMKMSKPAGSNQNLNQSMFSLISSNDPNFPHRFQVKLPRWALWDVDLKRWIVGFGGEVKVVQPSELVEAVQKFALELLGVYKT